MTITQQNTEATHQRLATSNSATLTQQQIRRIYRRKRQEQQQSERLSPLAMAFIALTFITWTLVIGLAAKTFG